MAVQPQYDEIGSRRRLQQLVEDLSAGGGVGGDGSGGGGDGGNDDDRAKRIERVKRTVDQLCPLSSDVQVVKGCGTVGLVVPDHLVSWDVPFDDYNPVWYTDEKILKEKPLWADPDVTDSDGFSKIKFNEIDGCIDRTSFLGHYKIVHGLPRNPVERTGITGRGKLGKWGPNHAADPIVTRWKRDAMGNKVYHQVHNIPLLEFVAIRRKDTMEWAIPGGMVDADEEISSTLKREFTEEAINSLREEDKEGTLKAIQNLFKSGKVVYKGYVDDPRNTDNSWMETVACNFHDDDGTTVGRIPLNAGDDACEVQWLTIDGPLKLYASHATLIEKVCTELGAFFPDTV